jgi:glycosyl transferase family 90
LIAGHSRLGERLVDALNARFLAKDLERALERRGRSAKVRVNLLGDGWPNDFEIERESESYLVTLPAAAQRRFVVGSRHFLRAYFYWMDLTGPNVRRITVNGSDGDRPSRAIFAASAPPGRQVPIPDPHFWRYEGFKAERERAAIAPEWDGRSEDVVWRGLGNGAGRISLDPRDRNDPSVIQRLRMCHILAGVPGCDVRINGLQEDTGVWFGPARQAGIGAGSIPAESWLSRKYAIDIDGQTNTWSNFLVRMLFGCCVFKVASPADYRQWYYDQLTPFEHYIPVRADMSDFPEKIDWARSHKAECRRIAAAARSFALGLDFEAGKRDAIELIGANWDKPSP